FNRLDVEDDAICTRLSVSVYPLCWLLDHQMHIKGLIRDSIDGFGDIWTKGQVRDEMAVHNVDVNPFGISHGLHLFAKACEIRSQDRRRDNWSTKRARSHAAHLRTFCAAQRRTLHPCHGGAATFAQTYARLHLPCQESSHERCLPRCLAPLPH